MNLCPPATNYIFNSQYITLQNCVNWNSKTLILSMKKKLLIMTPARVGKQLVPYRDLIGHHVAAVGCMDTGSSYCTY